MLLNIAESLGLVKLNNTRNYLVNPRGELHINDVIFSGETGLFFDIDNEYKYFNKKM